MDTKHAAIGPGASGHETGHEVQDANIQGILLTAIGLAIGAAIAFALVYGIFQYLDRQPLTTAPANPMADLEGPQLPPEPRIEEHPAIDIQLLHAREDRLLTTYGWTDKPAGIVRIPIDRAIELELQRGFPVRKEAATK